MAGQPEQPYARFAPHPTHVSDGIIEEPAGQLHPLVGCGHALEHRGADGLVASEVLQRLFAQGQLEGLGQVALDGFTGRLIRGVGLERVGRSAGKDQGAGRVQGATVRQLESGFGTAYQLGVEDTERAFDPRVQPVEPSGAVRDVPGDQHRQRDPADDPAEVHHVPPEFLPLRSNRAHRESGPLEVRTEDRPKMTVS
jgi:hypothetical protein